MLLMILLNKNQRRINELISISTILPGLVDPNKGIVHYMPHMKVNNWALVDNLEKLLWILPLLCGP